MDDAFLVAGVEGGAFGIVDGAAEMCSGPCAPQLRAGGSWTPSGVPSRLPRGRGRTDKTWPSNCTVVLSKTFSL